MIGRKTRQNVPLWTGCHVIQSLSSVSQSEKRERKREASEICAFWPWRHTIARIFRFCPNILTPFFIQSTGGPSCLMRLLGIVFVLICRTGRPTKGNLISEANCQAVVSPKKGTKGV